MHLLDETFKQPLKPTAAGNPANQEGLRLGQGVRAGIQLCDLLHCSHPFPSGVFWVGISLSMAARCLFEPGDVCRNNG